MSTSGATSATCSSCAQQRLGREVPAPVGEARRAPPSRATGSRRRAPCRPPSAPRTTRVPWTPGGCAGAAGRRPRPCRWSSPEGSTESAESLGERRERPPGGPAVRGERHDGGRVLRGEHGRETVGEVRQVGALEWPGRREDVRRELGHVAVLDVRDDDDRRAPQRRFHALGIRERRDEVAAEDEDRLDVPGLELVDNRDRGVLASLAGQLGRLAGPGSGAGSGVPGRVSSPCTKPGLNQTPPGRSSDPVTARRATESHCGEVSGRRHRGARPRLHGEPAVPADRGEQAARSAGSRPVIRAAAATSYGSTAARSSSTRSRARRGTPRSAPSCEELPDEEREQGVVRARPRGARWRVASLRGLGPAGVDDPQLPRAASSRSRAVGFGNACMWQLCETTGFVPSRSSQGRALEVDAWKSQPTPAMRRRTTGYEGASTVPEVNFVCEPRRGGAPTPAQQRFASNAARGAEGRATASGPLSSRTVAIVAARSSSSSSHETGTSSPSRRRSGPSSRCG